MKTITFITGTRADYGKIKSLILELQKKKNKFKTNLIITGMHNIRKYGYTIDEINKDKIRNCYSFNNQSKNATMDIILANTIKGINKFLLNIHTDLIVVHGDRVESLAGAITGLDFDWNLAPWDETIGKRAPTYVRVTMSFQPIHD